MLLIFVTFELLRWISSKASLYSQSLPIYINCMMIICLLFPTQKQKNEVTWHSQPERVNVLECNVIMTEKKAWCLGYEMCVRSSCYMCKLTIKVDRNVETNLLVFLSLHLNPSSSVFNSNRNSLSYKKEFILETVFTWSWGANTCFCQQKVLVSYMLDWNNICVNMHYFLCKLLTI